jgi:hypothetical protein
VQVQARVVVVGAGRQGRLVAQLDEAKLFHSTGKRRARLGRACKGATVAIRVRVAVERHVRIGLVGQGFEGVPAAVCGGLSPDRRVGRVRIDPRLR